MMGGDSRKHRDSFEVDDAPSLGSPCLKIDATQHPEGDALRI